MATTDTDTGAPRLTPLSFLWHDETLLFATSAAGPTGRNLAANPSVQVGIGLTRDVVLVQGTVEVLPTRPGRRSGDAFAAKAGFDPRTSRPLPVLPAHAAHDPGVARGERAGRPLGDARRGLASVTTSSPVHRSYRGAFQ